MLARRRVPFGSLDDNFVNGAYSSPDPADIDTDTKSNMADRVRPSSARESGRTSGRDRTVEFLSVIKYTQSRNPRFKVTSSPIQSSSKNEFPVISSKIGQDMSSSFEKLESLKLIISKKQDPASQEAANRLTDIMRQDLGLLNKQIAQLQQFLKHQVFNRQKMAHSNSVIVALQSKLVRMFTEFKVVLEVKQQNVMSSISTTNSTQRSTAVDGRTNTKGSVRPRGFDDDNGMSYSVSSDRRQTLPTSRTSQQPNLYDPLHDNVREERPLHPFQDQRQSKQMLRQRFIQEQPKDEMIKIEQTIVELGGIFQQLTTMVHEQGEMVQRIDSHIDDTQLNIDEAHTELVKYFKSVASMRSLMLKVFAVLIIFIIFFLFVYL